MKSGWGWGEQMRIQVWGDTAFRLGRGGHTERAGRAAGLCQAAHKDGVGEVLLGSPEKRVPSESGRGEQPQSWGPSAEVGGPRL